MDITNKAFGKDSILSTPIFNPGATKYDRYTIMDLEKNDKTGWEIKSIQSNTI